MYKVSIILYVHWQWTFDLYPLKLMSKLQLRTFPTRYILIKICPILILFIIYYYFLGCGWVAFEMWGFELRVGFISTRMSKLQFRTFPTQARITQVLNGAAQQKHQKLFKSRNISHSFHAHRFIRNFIKQYPVKLQY